MIVNGVEIVNGGNYGSGESESDVKVSNCFFFQRNDILFEEHNRCSNRREL